jgi:hypothetical protein
MIHNFNEFIFESFLSNDDLLLEFADKDLQRINGIIDKSNGIDTKMIQLAKTMASKIKDSRKAFDRGHAAAHVFKQLGIEDPISIIFYDRARELGFDVDLELQGNTLGDFKKSGRFDRGGAIFLPSWSSIALWEHEITGQLSDGAWENTRPYDHWKFWNDLEVKKGKSEVQYSGMWPQKKNYNLNSLIQYVGDRMVNLGRLGKALGKNLTYDQRIMAEYMPKTLEKWESERDSANGRRKEYFMSITKRDAERYYKTDYSERDMKNDLKVIKVAMTNLKRVK